MRVLKKIVLFFVNLVKRILGIIFTVIEMGFAITQNYVTLSNVYIDGKYVYAQIPTSNTGSSFYLTNGYSACTLKSGTFYSRSSYNSSWQLDIGWDINFTTYGSFNYIFPNYFDPVWTISIGNVDYVEIQT